MASIRWGIKYTPDKTHDKDFLQERLINDPTSARRGELFLNEPRKSIYFVDSSGFIQEINPDLGAFYPAEDTVTENYNILNKQKVFFNSLGGSFNLTVPIYEEGEDHYFWLINAGIANFPNQVIVVPQAGQTIEGQPIYPINNNHPSIVFQLVGTDWRIVNGYKKTVPTVVLPPTTAIDPGVVGQVAYDTNYYYVCVAENEWKRAELLTW